MTSRFAQSLGREGYETDPETEEMQNELNEYYKKERKEELKVVLAEKRKQHGDAPEAKANDLNADAANQGFVIDDRRS